MASREEDIGWFADQPLLIIGENEILADDYDTVSFNRDFGKRADGVPFDFQVAIRWEIENGQIKVMTEYIQDEAHKAEFF